MRIRPTYEMKLHILKGLSLMTTIHDEGNIPGKEVLFLFLHFVFKFPFKTTIPSLRDTRSIKVFAYEVNHTVTQFNSIKNSLFSAQHIVTYNNVFFYIYDVLKRKRAEDSAYVGSFPNRII